MGEVEAKREKGSYNKIVTQSTVEEFTEENLKEVSWIMCSFHA